MWGRSAMTGARLLNADEAAALLNVKRSWVMAEARADRIPHLKLGHYTRFDEGELLAWLKTQRRGPGVTTDSRRGSS